LPLLESLPFLIAGELESRSWIFVTTAGAPIWLSVARARLPLDECRSGLCRRGPGPTALEPIQRYIRLRALKLVKRWEEILAPLRAKRRGHGAVDDDPERVRAGHA
jgi:hypothetical protein